MKELFVNLDKVQEITNDYPTPYHLYDEKGIRENARDLYKAFSWNKGFKEYFAVKATPNPEILKILREEGCGVDCSSYTELMLSEACGFSGDEIMFSSNVTPAEDFKLASDLGSIINFDDITHIDFFENVVGSFPETICCRFNPGGTFNISDNVMDTPGDAKYGLTEDQMVEAFKKLKAKGVKHFGIHSFLASNTVSNEYYPALSRVLFKLAVKLKNEADVHISFINLSGGVGVPYKPEESKNDIFAIGDGVRLAFEEILTANDMGDVKIFAELGRYMLAPFACLVATALHRKETHKSYIGLDACAANLMRPAMYGSYHHITVLGKETAPLTHTYDVTGGLCENNDKFAIDRNLPHIDIGDYVVLHDTGAHGSAMGYNYNGKLRSAEVLLKEDGKTELIRRAETPEDYFATLDFMRLFNKN